MSNFYYQIYVFYSIVYICLPLETVTRRIKIMPAWLSSKLSIIKLIKPYFIRYTYNCVVPVKCKIKKKNNNSPFFFIIICVFWLVILKYYYFLIRQLFLDFPLKRSQYPTHTATVARKICVRTPKTCDQRSWSFDTVHGELKVASKQHYKAISRTGCMDKCLNEKNFQCRQV